MFLQTIYCFFFFFFLCHPSVTNIWFWILCKESQEVSVFVWMIILYTSRLWFLTVARFGIGKEDKQRKICFPCQNYYSVFILSLHKRFFFLSFFTCHSFVSVQTPYKLPPIIHLLLLFPNKLTLQYVSGRSLLCVCVCVTVSEWLEIKNKPGRGRQAIINQFTFTWCT